MIWVLSVTVGVLFTCGLYLMMRRSLLKLILGLILLGHGANLAVFVSAGLTRSPAPLVELGDGCRVWPRASVYKGAPDGTNLRGNPAKPFEPEGDES